MRFSLQTATRIATSGIFSGASMALVLVGCSSSDSSPSPEQSDASMLPETGSPATEDAGASIDAGSEASDSGGTSAESGSDGSPTSTSDSGDAGSSSTDGPVAVTIRFQAKVGSQPFACGTTYPGQGSAATSVEPRDFRFYLQDIRLIDDHAAEVPLTLDTRSPWQTPEIVLLDFEDATGACAAEGNAEMNKEVTGTVPPGNYTGIVFRNGVPEALSHADPLTVPAPLQPAAMTWGWLFGYKFIKAELASTVAPTGDAAPGFGLLHLGSVGCSNATDAGPDYNAPPSVACTQSNRNEIRLTGFVPASNVIVADIGAIFRAVDLSQDNQCHSGGPSCPSMFAAAGVDLTTGAALPTQSIYRVE